jgi:hypothetical protein
VSSPATKKRKKEKKRKREMMLPIEAKKSALLALGMAPSNACDSNSQDQHSPLALLKAK